MIVDALTAERIGLQWLRAALAPVGAFGRRHDEGVALYGPGDEGRARAEIAECRALADRVDAEAIDRLRGALRAIPEPTPLLLRARAGDVLTDVDFYELTRFADTLDAFARAWDATAGSQPRAAPSVDELRALLVPGRSETGFYLDAGFDQRLDVARTALRSSDAELEGRRRAAAARVRETLGVEAAGADLLLMRDVHDGMLPPDLLLVREAPAYRVVSVRLESGARDIAFAAVAAAEAAVRARLSARIAEISGEVDRATAALGSLDRLLARAAFTRRWGGCVPVFSARLAFNEGVFAPLADALHARGLRYTPLAFALSDVAVLTGPNMGGKSSALATAGFLCCCAALGVPPPAATAEMPLLERVTWVGGDEPERRVRLLSAYAGEIVRGGAALTDASPRALVLIDEFAHTTGPREGRALLIALLEALHARGALAMAATHFEDVGGETPVSRLRVAGLSGASFAQLEEPDVERALDEINAVMDYRIVAAPAMRAASGAFELAELLGLESAVVARAREIYARPDPLAP